MEQSRIAASLVQSGVEGVVNGFVRFVVTRLPWQPRNEWQPVPCLIAMTYGRTGDWNSRKCPQSRILVANPYYHYLINVSVWYKYYCSGSTDGLLIWDETPIHWDDMAACEKGAKDSELRNEIVIDASVEEKSEIKTRIAEDQDKKKGPKCMRCIKAFFVILGVIGVIAAVSLIILAVLTSLATKAYDSEQSHRMVAMVLLAVSAAVTICVIIYGEVAVFKRHSRPIHVAAVVLLLLAIVQALIAGISVNVEPADEAKLLRSLSESFKQAREENPRHVKIWAMTQSDLNCCGIYSPEDYRSSKLPYYFPPNVPISCCSTYDSSRSDLVQERDRELCKVKKTYYTGGCKDLVLLVFKETSSMVFTVAVLLIVIEVLLLIIGAVLSRRKKGHDGESS
ncbi:hypothetical protein PYW08_003600 [Mythimna loreyi]|uniref:Uncharacterized protein n=1 Tax=Mythimna loreyi TaxID=667449 RepID=A0ACC2QTD8_9NEOP|nr:hypothetical protein PYW08_003600 [Mythimna loreyi]